MSGPSPSLDAAAPALIGEELDDTSKDLPTLVIEMIQRFARGQTNVSLRRRGRAEI
jgi:hypothetical protein